MIQEEELFVKECFSATRSSSPVLESLGDSCQRQNLGLHPRSAVNMGSMGLGTLLSTLSGYPLKSEPQDERNGAEGWEGQRKEEK